MTRLLVRSCGPMTSLQDAGRAGSRRFGVSGSGAMDRLALAHANVLVGNAPGAAAIELALLGGTFAVADGPVRIALAGAPMAARIAGRPLAEGMSATLREGESVTVGAAGAGVFAYMAVAGGFDLEPVLGSLSLHARAGLGGFGGRALRPGDALPLAGPAPAGPELRLPPVGLDRGAPVRIVLGPQDDAFDDAAVAAFLSAGYAVSAEADRMGYRLSGPPIPHRSGFNIVSDGIVAGSVQVPGSGTPIVMMADHQTTGGYPKIATVISADLRVVAQRRGGDIVRFRAISVEESHEVARGRAEVVRDLARAARPVAAGLPDAEVLLGMNLAGHATDALAPEP